MDKELGKRPRVKFRGAALVSSCPRQTLPDLSVVTRVVKETIARVVCVEDFGVQKEKIEAKAHVG